MVETTLVTSFTIPTKPKWTHFHKRDPTDHPRDPAGNKGRGVSGRRGEMRKEGEDRPHVGDFGSVTEMRMSMRTRGQSALAIDKFLAHNKAIINS
jgi:hypothetical protein